MGCSGGSGSVLGLAQWVKGGVVHIWGLESVPGLGISIYHGCSPKKKKERKEKREGKKISVNVARHKAHPYMERNSFLPFHSFRKILVSACNLLSTVLEATYLYSIKRMHHSHRGGVIVTIFSEA